MTMVLDGTSGITTNSGTVVSTTDATLNGLTVGKGGGTVSTNTAVGNSALNANTSGGSNTAVGVSALAANTTASNNTAVGYEAGIANTTGRITAFGHRVLYSNTTGTGNVGVGGNDGSVASALLSNTTGSSNTGIGVGALLSNTTASNNTAVGYQAGYSANGTTGSQGGYNTFVGRLAGYSLTTGYSNTLIGQGAGYLLTTGSLNTFIGSNSDTNSSGQSMTTGSKNSIFGNFSGNQGGLDIRTSSNYIVLSDGDGNPRAYWNSTGIFYCYQVYANNGAASSSVQVDSTGQIYRLSSALKYKTDVRDLESIDISKFRPVRYKSLCSIDDPTKDHFGVIADEVDANGFKELVNYGVNGEVEGFQYEKFTVVLLKAIQELKAIVDSQALEIAELKGRA